MKTQKSPIDLIDFCKKYANNFQQEIEGKEISLQKNTYLISALWMRIIELNKAVIVLADTGLATNSFILLRTMCETFILLETCIHNESFANTYFNKMYKEKSKRLKSISESLDKIQSDFTLEEIAKLRKRFSDMIPEEQSSDYRAKTLFYNTNYISLYEMVYCHCSTFTHTEASILDRYIEETDKIPILTPNKSIYPDTVLTCLMSASLFRQSFKSYCNYIRHESVHLEGFLKEYNDIQELYKSV